MVLNKKNLWFPFAFFYFGFLVWDFSWQPPLEKTSPFLHLCPLWCAYLGPSVSILSATRGVVPLGTDVFVNDGSQKHISRFWNQTTTAREDISRRVQKFRHNKVTTVLLVWPVWNRFKHYCTSRILNTKVLPKLLRLDLLDYLNYSKCYQNNNNDLK